MSIHCNSAVNFTFNSGILSDANKTGHTVYTPNRIVESPSKSKEPSAQITVGWGGGLKHAHYYCTHDTHLAWSTSPSKLAYKVPTPPSDSIIKLMTFLCRKTYRTTFSQSELQLPDRWWVVGERVRQIVFFIYTKE